MEKKKVLVIGAGVAGLSAAIRLQNAGYAVEIYEKTDKCGGKMDQIKKDGYTYDVGPTLVMMPSIYRELFEAANKNPDDYIQLIKLDPMYDVYFNREEFTHYEISSDLNKLTEIMEEKGGHVSSGFLTYVSDIYKRYLVALKYFIRRPFRSWKDIYNPKMLRQVFKLKTFDSADSMMNKYIQNKDISQIFSFQTLYIGVSPKKGPSLYNIIPMIELLYGVWFPKGGMYSVALGMERLFKELGGTIHYDSPASQILIEDKKAIGIEVGGKKITGDYVISNADFPYTMKSLIKEKAVKGKYTDKKIDQLDYSCSCLVFYWGMSKKYNELHTHTFVVAADLDRNLKQIFDGDFVDDASIYLSIPSRGDDALAPANKDSFYVLLPVSEISTAKYEYNEEVIAQYKKVALDKLKRLPGCENVENEIISESVMTPIDFQDKFNAYNGATFGLQPTLKQSNHFRPQAKAKNCENLYFTGSSTHPGAGVPIVMESGKICSEELRRDNKEDPFE